MNTNEPINPANVVISDFSDFGPTDDGRLGVMLVGAGEGTTSAPYIMPFGTSDTLYSTGNRGTSFAAPNVAGSLALAMEHYEDAFGELPDAATTKALALHTALDIGNVGPDYSTGYGLLDMAALTTFVSAASVPAAQSAQVITASLAQGHTWTRDFLVGSTLAAPPPRNFSATLMWTDPAGPVDANITLDENTPDLVNDLEMRIQRLDSAGNVVETYFPWVLDRANPAANATQPNTGNHVDVVEQVRVQGAPALQTNGEPWRYRLQVSHMGNLTNAPQNFSVTISAGSVQAARDSATGTVTFTEAVTGNTDCLVLRRNAAGELEYSTDGVGFSNDLDSTAAGIQAMTVANINRINVRLQGGDDRLLLDYASGLAAGPTRAGLIIDYDGGAGTDLFVDSRSGTAAVTLNGTSVNATLAGGGRTDTLTNVEQVELSGDAADNTISAAGVNDALSPIHVRLLGLRGRDTLTGGVGNDTISGGLARDSLAGGAGNDSVLGGTDKDTLDGGLGNDSLDGDVGDDSLVGGAGDDRLDGGPGKNTLIGLDGKDTLIGGDGIDSLVGGLGDDSLLGGAGKEKLVAGNEDNDSADAGPGTDKKVFGGTGNDTLAGGADKDKLFGEPGSDSLTGGPAKDSFDCGVDTDTDVITDQEQGESARNCP